MIHDVDPRLLDTGFLAGSMRDAQFLGQGGNNKAWRIAGVPGDYVLRVNYYHSELFVPGLEAILHPAVAMEARAAVPLASFTAEDEKGRRVALADVQPEIKGVLLGLTVWDRKSRSDETDYVLTETDGWGRPAGTKGKTYVPNPGHIARTNAHLWGLAERIAGMPLDFYLRAMRDVMEIEENGFGIDPSKAANFLLGEDDRLGFVDLMPGAAYRITPGTLATVLWQPANQTHSALDTPEDSARRADLRDTIKGKMVMAADKVGIAYGYHKGDMAEEQTLRAKFALAQPQNLRPVLLDEGGRPLGYGIRAAQLAFGG